MEIYILDNSQASQAIVKLSDHCVYKQEFSKHASKDKHIPILIKERKKPRILAPSVSSKMYKKILVSLSFKSLPIDHRQQHHSRSPDPPIELETEAP